MGIFKISQLPIATNVDYNEKFLIVQNGDAKQASISCVLSNLATNIASIPDQIKYVNDSAGLSVYNLSDEVKNNFVKTSVNNALSAKVNTIANDYLKTADKNTIIGNAGLSVYNLSSNLSSQVRKDEAALKLGIKTCLTSFAGMMPDSEGNFDCDLNTVISALISMYNFANA